MRTLVSSTDLESAPLRIVIVGGGAAAVITAAHLLRAADGDRPVDVRIIETRPAIGPGLAYGTDHRLHTLNNFAGRLSAVDSDPDHLVRWCASRGLPADPMSFLPREVYGRYLRDVLDDIPVPPRSMLRRTRGLVTDLRPEGTELEVVLSCGWTVRADKVVLALGNPPPRRQEQFETWGDRYVPDPWSGDLAERIGTSREVLLVGTGLTMIDVVATLHESSPETRFTAVSRNGLLPRAHARRTLRLHDIFKPGTASLDQLVARVEERIEELEDVGGDWRDVVDSVRACANDLWQGFSAAEQDRFVERLARHWEVARHRMPPDMAAFIEHLQQSGSLRVARLDEVDSSGFDRVVNCTGPAPVPTPGWNPLVDALLERGTVRPHRLGLGLELDPDGRVVDLGGQVNPDVYAVGAARRGLEWEVTAIPDLRAQATRLAARLLDIEAASGEAATARSLLA